MGADEKCVLNFNIKKNDKLYACVRVSYSDDLVEIISWALDIFKKKFEYISWK